MDILLLGIYAFCVWLVFFKFKLLPWNIVSQVIVVIIPIVALTVMILTLNVVAPSSADVRVIKYVINMSSDMRGRVIEVAEGNRPLKKGDVIYRVDPTPYQLQVNALEAQLANTVGGSRELEEQLAGSMAQVAQTKSGIDQAQQRVNQSNADLELAQKRVAQHRELSAKGAGNRFDLEQAETNLRNMQAAMDSARSAEAQSRSAYGQALAGERQIRQRMGAKSGGEWAQIAQIRAQLDQAKFELSQTVVRAPANGTPINVQLRPGALVTVLANMPALTFVEEEFTVVALYDQNELVKVKPGDDAEIALATLPGEIIKAKVDSIIWAQGQGQSAVSGQLPNTAGPKPPPGKFPVKLTVDPKYREYFFAAGARGDAAIYTESLEFLHILRKVIIRVGTKLNYLVLKLH
jgi:multidrug resistance efflux pump